MFQHVVFFDGDVRVAVVSVGCIHAACFMEIVCRSRQVAHRIGNFAAPHLIAAACYSLHVGLIDFNLIHYFLGMCVPVCCCKYQ